MNINIRRTVVIASALAALGAASGAFALNQDQVDKYRADKAQGQQQSQPAAQQQRPPRADAAPRGNEPRNGNRGGDARGNSGGGDRNVAGGGPPRNYGNPGNGPARGDVRGGRDDRRGNYGGNRPPRTVQTLPHGYRNYNWNGRSYYNYGGRWYRPYGGSYISIGVPYGLFVSTLPGYSNSFWYGNSRYYYYDDNYYVYEPVRRGYVVTHSPYGDDPVDSSSDTQALDDDLYIYPAKGQSEQQQSDDRYECHKWAADETHYDPVDDAYQPDDRADYLRAMTACLTGRGYSVK
jgi:hypothetical protein